MKVLYFLVDSFVNGFGITKPRPEQQRMVALTLGAFLLVNRFKSVLVYGTRATLGRG